VSGLPTQSTVRRALLVIAIDAQRAECASMAVKVDVDREAKAVSRVDRFRARCGARRGRERLRARFAQVTAGLAELTASEQSMTSVDRAKRTRCHRASLISTARDPRAARLKLILRASSSAVQLPSAGLESAIAGALVERTIADATRRRMSPSLHVAEPR
jgi:hypothetical protein